MTKDPERIKRRAAAAAALGLSEDELRQQRAGEDARNLERKAADAGVPVERYLAQRRKERNRSRRSGGARGGA